jgi:phage-related protein
MHFFTVLFMEEARNFIQSLGHKEIKKVLYNLDIAEKTQDSRLFKKLGGNIWEFRVLSGGQQIRLLAFWDKRSSIETLVIATHGFVKKTGKVPAREIARAEKSRLEYFQQTKPQP